MQVRNSPARTRAATVLVTLPLVLSVVGLSMNAGAMSTAPSPGRHTHHTETFSKRGAVLEAFVGVGGQPFTGRNSSSFGLAV